MRDPRIRAIGRGPRCDAHCHAGGWAHGVVCMATATRVVAPTRARLHLRAAGSLHQPAGAPEGGRNGGAALKTTEGAVASKVVTSATVTRFGASGDGRGRRAESARRGGSAAPEPRPTCGRLSTACCSPVRCAGERRAAAGLGRRVAPVAGAPAEVASTRATRGTRPA